jgi:tRNA (mo5U34)-methyltransferase
MIRPRSFLRRLLGGSADANGVATARPVPSPPRITDRDALLARVKELGGWMYRFDVGAGVTTALYDDYLESIHRTRSAMIFPRLEAMFAGRWRDARCLDVACNEGFFAFELARRGAGRVIAFDARELNIRKAAFVRAQLGLTQVELRVDDLYSMSRERYGEFDITLCLGLLYHVEDVMGALRRLRAVTRGVLVIDTEVVRPGSRAIIDRGPAEGVVETEDVLAVVAEEGWEWNPLASVTGLSIVPNLSALRTMLKHAGFADVEVVPPPPSLDDGGGWEVASRYRDGERVILFARVASAAPASA